MAAIVFSHSLVLIFNPVCYHLNFPLCSHIFGQTPRVWPFSINVKATLVTRPKPYYFTTDFQRLISVGFQLLISNNWNPTEIAWEKTFTQPLKTPTFQTENQPFSNIGNTFFNGCWVTRESDDNHRSNSSADNAIGSVCPSVRPLTAEPFDLQPSCLLACVSNNCTDVADWLLIR